MVWTTGSPEKRGRYLICGASRVYSVKIEFESELARYRPDEDSWEMLDKTGDGITSDFFVTHWMPLPEGPNEPTEQGNGRVVELEEGSPVLEGGVEKVGAE